MHVILVSPFSSGPIRGNIITVNRIARHLQLLGIQTTTLPLDRYAQKETISQLAASPPDLLHAFHAFHSGPLARSLSQQLQIPYLVTITGSDLFDPAFRDHPATILALQDAHAITCFDSIIAERLAATYPGLSGKTVVIPQGVDPLPDSKPLSRPPDSFIVLLPAALRPVKGVLEAIDALTPLIERIPNLQLWLAGGELDSDYAGQIRQRAATLNWIRLLGELPHDRMGAVYRAADLVLNASLFEGGMANCLLEAMTCARPVLARDIAGNRSLVRHGETGWLYRDEHDLRDMISLLAEQPGQREEVGRAAALFVSDCFSAANEAAALLSLYCRITQV